MENVGGLIKKKPSTPRTPSKSLLGLDKLAASMKEKPSDLNVNSEFKKPDRERNYRKTYLREPSPQSVRSEWEIHPED